MLSTILLSHQCKKLVAFTNIGGHKRSLESIKNASSITAHENIFWLITLAILCFTLQMCTLFLSLGYLFKLSSLLKDSMSVCYFKLVKKICVHEFYASRMCVEVHLWFLPSLKQSSSPKAFTTFVVTFIKCPNFLVVFNPSLKLIKSFIKWEICYSIR